MADRGDASNTSRTTTGRGRGRARARERERSKSASRPGGLANNEAVGASSARVVLTESMAGSAGDSGATTPTTTTTMGADAGQAATDAPATALTLATKTGAGRGRSSAAGAATAPGDGHAAVRSGDSVLTAVSKLSDESVVLAKRNGYGRAGRPIQLRTNFFTIKVKGDLQVTQYRVDIRTEGYERKLDKDDNYAIFWQAARKLGWLMDEYSVLYDGGNMVYALTPLIIKGRKEDRITVDVPMPRHGGVGKYSIGVEVTGIKSLEFGGGNPKTAQITLAVLDLIWRQTYNMPVDNTKDRPFHPFGRSFFTVPSPGDRLCFDLDGGRQCWSGYYYAAKWGVDFVPLLNIDVAHSVFLKGQSFLSFMCDILNQAAGTATYFVEQLAAMKEPYYLKKQEVTTLDKAIKGYYVTTYTAPMRMQKVNFVTEESAEQLTFDVKDGDGVRKVTVAAYFAQRHKPLKYPFFPCLNTGGKRRSALLPLEVCDIYSPQRVRGKLTDVQTSAMIKGVCTDAVERERRITTMINRAGMEQDKFAQRFGLQVNTKTIDVNGRVLPPPTLHYFSNVRVVPREGVWQMNNTKLHVPGKITAYGVVSFIGQGQQRELAEFCGALMATARQMGMQVDLDMPTSVVYIRHSGEVRGGIDRCLTEIAQKGNKCDIIIVPMQTKNTENYAAVKANAEREFGVSTQVVLQRNIRPPKPQTLSNIVLKINAKLGGINCKLMADEVTSKYLVNQPTLVLGLDVTHPGPADKKTPSIGAAVGNIDLLPGKFGASISVQKHRREAVVYLTEAIQQRLRDFWERTGVMPTRIIIYRDGVAEGQFAQILKEEMKGLRTALNAIGGADLNPKITFIVVQKRHHARFFCSSERDMNGRGRNVPAGTVVDTKITDAELYDFYLCSHAGIQGTSRPTHYYVLRDDNSFTQDELQSITYQMCHLYARCTRSVSIPAPVYYAHLACERARHHLHYFCGDRDDSDTKSTISSSSDGSVAEDAMKASVVVTEDIRGKMYFC